MIFNKYFTRHIKCLTGFKMSDTTFSKKTHKGERLENGKDGGNGK